MLRKNSQSLWATLKTKVFRDFMCKKISLLKNLSGADCRKRAMLNALAKMFWLSFNIFFYTCKF